MRFFKRLWVEVTSFFEDDETGEEEINLKVLSIIFLLGLLLLFGLYFLVFDESKMVYNLPSNIFWGVYNRSIGPYNGVVNFIVSSKQEVMNFIVSSKQEVMNFIVSSKQEVMNLIYSSAIGEIKTITNSYQTLSCEGCKINTRFESEQEKELLVLDYQLSHKNWVWRQVHKVFERVFKISVDFGWVQINKKLDYVDWSQHDTLILSAKGTGKPSGLEFSIIESDGDAWYYFDKNSLTSEDWVEIRMPFKDFVNPKWASYGDGKKEFKNITQIAVTITNFDRPIENTLYFGTFDGEIFKLV